MSRPDARQIAEAVSGVTSVPVADIFGPGREMPRVLARWMAIHLFWTLNNGVRGSVEDGRVCLHDAARSFNRDYSSISHALREFPRRLAQDRARGGQLNQQHRAARKALGQ